MRRRNRRAAKRVVQKNKRKVARKQAAPALTADLQKRLAQRTHERDEALEREKRKCCASSVRLPAGLSRSSRPCWKMRFVYVEQILACFSCARGMGFAEWRCTTRGPPTSR